MRNLIFISLLSNISFANESIQKIEPTMPWMIPWVMGCLLIIGLLFWSFYKAMKTNNPKYGYVIFLGIILMIAMFYI